LVTMSLVSVVNRCLANTVKTQGRSLLSMSSGVNKVLLARNISLDFKNLEIAPGRSIAYRRLEGKKPTIVYVPGCDHEGIDGPMEESLLRYCDMQEHGCVMYDLECYGMSKGNTPKVLFSHWIENTLAVVDRLTEGSVILVGSGMGAWISLVVAQFIACREEVKRNSIAEELASKVRETKPALQTFFPSRLHSLVLWYPFLNHMPEYAYFDDSGWVGSTERLVDSSKYHLDLEKTIKIPDCPVKILGTPSSLIDLKLMKSLSTDDVEMVYRKASLGETDGEVCLRQLNRLILDKPVVDEEEARRRRRQS